MISAAPSVPPAPPISNPEHCPNRANCARTAALTTLRQIDPTTKAAAARALYAAALDGSLACFADLELAEPTDLPGRPARPELVDPRKLKRRSMQSPERRAVF